MEAQKIAANIAVYPHIIADEYDPDSETLVTLRMNPERTAFLLAVEHDSTGLQTGAVYSDRSDALLAYMEAVSDAGTDLSVDDLDAIARLTFGRTNFKDGWKAIAVQVSVYLCEYAESRWIRPESLPFRKAEQRYGITIDGASPLAISADFPDRSRVHYAYTKTGIGSFGGFPIVSSLENLPKLIDWL